jgi:hypothetical protein
VRACASWGADCCKGGRGGGRHAAACDGVVHASHYTTCQLRGCQAAAMLAVPSTLNAECRCIAASGNSLMLPDYYT